MNFWELKLDEEGVEDKTVKAFEENECIRLQNVILEIMDKKKDQTEPFKTRVLEKIAPDYRSHIKAEMFFDLILARLAKNYYRH